MRRSMMPMKTLSLFGISAVLAAVLILAAREATAQSRPVGGVMRNNFSGHSNLFSWERGDGFRGGFHGGHFHGFGGGLWVVDREVPYIVEQEAPAPAPP